MIKYKLTVSFRDTVIHPFLKSFVKCFTVEVTEDQLDGDETCISIGNVAYPIHNITSIKREVVADELQSKDDEPANGA